MTSHRQRELLGFGDDDPAPATASTKPVESKAVDSKTVDQEGSSLEQAELPSVEGKTVYVIDAHSLIYQVFHGMPEMTSPTGQPVAAIYGFTRDILDIVENRKPDFLFCAFDAPGGETFRHELLETYKGNRVEMPVDLRPQIPAIQRMLTALGVPSLVCENYEADDILATIARRTESLGGNCVLVTGDKDCRQLISDHVQVLNIRKNELCDAERLKAEWGIEPTQVVDYQALVGDPVDSIPGVPLIGPKNASELLRQYGTLENLFDHVDEVAGTKRRENLKNFRDQALLSRQLARLDENTPIDLDWQAARVGGVDLYTVMALCREFGFRRMSERIAGMSVASSPAAWQADYRMVASLDELQRLSDEMRHQARLVFDTETTAVSPRFAELVGVSFAWQEGVAYYVPVRAPRGEPQLEVQQVLAILRPVLEDPAIEKIGQNLKYDLIVLRNYGLRVRGVAFDTMVADYLLEPGERIHNMDDLAKRYLNHATIKIADLIGSGKNQKRMDEVPVALITSYAAEDADVPLRLSHLLERRLEEDQLTGLFRDLEMPLVEVLAEMEFNGIRIDVDRLSQLSQRYGQRIQTLQAEIYELAGGAFNIDSPKQLGNVLFQQLKLPVLRKTRTGPSTDADVLSDLSKVHPLPAKIIDYRQNAKLKSTYVDALPLLIHPVTGRVHTSFKQDVAATGRLSSTDPNLQNIPIRTEEGREIREAFLPEKDWLLLSADYSQIELRVLAHYSGDVALQQAFQEDRDVHTQVAAEVYGVTLDQVTREMRRSAKAVNFGVVYGQSPFGLANALDISKADAAQFIDRYFARYAGVAAFIRQTLEDCRRQGYVSTILGRRRAVQGVRDPAKVTDPYQRTMQERIAINTVIQGSAADLIKRAMIRVHGRLQRENLRARLLLQIHDELVLEVAPEDRDALSRLVVEEMSSAGQLAVPLKVDLKTGANWAECE